MTTGEKFGQWLRDHGKTQRGASVDLGTDEAAVCRWVKGNRVPGREIAFDIERYTGGAIRANDWEPTERAKKRRAKESFSSPMAMDSILDHEDADDLISKSLAVLTRFKEQGVRTTDGDEELIDSLRRHLARVRKA